MFKKKLGVKFYVMVIFTALAGAGLVIQVARMRADFDFLYSPAVNLIFEVRHISLLIAFVFFFFVCRQLRSGDSKKQGE
ncbi:hypothetical protein KUV39_08660 [Phaeobacter italicus]|uniref:hypothetical protein n=1 Tax=Phaeobacter italicus TaxID=481446 RepID=UPI001C94299F|nr:hypothetical protein [Phaeobacter italicus]MBY5976716.1 hypothetical protein [Phaeobacter italicus]